MKVFDLSEFQPDDRVYTLAEEHDADGVILKLGETLSGTPTLDPKFETFRRSSTTPSRTSCHTAFTTSRTRGAWMISCRKQTG